MRSIDSSSRTRIAALLVAFAFAACGGADPTEEGAADSGTPAATDSRADDGANPTAGDQASPDPSSQGATPASPAAGASGVAVPAPATVIQVQEVNAPGLVAELTEVTRKDGVLTVKVRFRNTGSETLHHAFETHHGRYERFYVTAGDQKYFVLKDSEGEPLAPKYLTVDLDPGATSTWWAKFPAPPASATAIDLVIADTPPFEDVPIADR